MEEDCIILQRSSMRPFPQFIATVTQKTARCTTHHYTISSQQTPFLSSNIKITIHLIFRNVAKKTRGIPGVLAFLCWKRRQKQFKNSDYACFSLFRHQVKEDLDPFPSYSKSFYVAYHSLHLLRAWAVAFNCVCFMSVPKLSKLVLQYPIFSRLESSFHWPFCASSTSTELFRLLCSIFQGHRHFIQCQSKHCTVTARSRLLLNLRYWLAFTIIYLAHKIYT